jgi:hypothetical protein
MKFRSPRSSFTFRPGTRMAGALMLLLGVDLFGADDPWSLQKIGHPQPPQRQPGAWGNNAIDAFVGVKIEPEGLVPTPQADRRALIRRVSYDLIGLPPVPEQVQKFVEDPRPDAEAFRDLAGELLASNHYGEHWGRHWLDVVRYADTAGENSDHPLPQAWRYRNWVIDAFNADKPYDQFVREQLAGDILSKGKPLPEGNAAMIATGYLAIARRFGHDIDKRMHLTHEDVIDNFGKAFLGLSISCARCHDHKHDPIPTRDYYALYGVFDSTRFSFPGCEPKQQPRDLIPLATDELLAQRKAWERHRDELAAKRAELEKAKAPAQKLKDIAAKSFKIISQGDVPDGGSVHVSSDPIKIDVKQGEAIQLSILPQENYGADTTILDFAINHSSAKGEITRWSLNDLIDDLISANPHPAKNGVTWCFLDTTGDLPQFLIEKKGAVDGMALLNSWGNGTPSVMVNKSTEPVKVWTTLPPRTFFCHPGEHGPVAIAWLSSVDGTVTIDLKISDGHAGGDGVAWRLEHFADPVIGDAYRELGKAGGVLTALDQSIAEHAAKEPTVPVAYGVTEGEAKETKVHRNGNHEDLGETVPRTFLTMFGGGVLGDAKSSGRLELAERITSPDNPLAARVMVNRIWSWHFGRGLVATPNDFGNHGARPSHPELLDFLARYLMDHDWSLKAVHRLILGSATYQQAARDDVPPETFAAFSRRRLSAEELRDTLLIAAGKLDRAPGEAHPFPPEKSWSFTQHGPFSAEYDTDKRSVYVMRKRNRSSRFFALFNGADPNASTAARDVTTAPTQALYFMNDPFFHDCAERFAQRIQAAAPDSTGRLDFACRLLFARPVTEEETIAFTEFSEALSAALDGSEQTKEAETWKAYARVLLGSNELLHTD